MTHDTAHIITLAIAFAIMWYSTDIMRQQAQAPLMNKTGFLTLLKINHKIMGIAVQPAYETGSAATENAVGNCLQWELL